MTASTPRPKLAPVDRQRLERDVRSVARSRSPGSPGWSAVQSLIAERLTKLEFAVERHRYGTGVNIIGRRGPATGGTVIVSAHYDHLERCAGADDNASGVAAALEVARLLNSAPLARQLVIALWDEEERGLIGSRAFATEARQRADRIALMISFDAIGVRHREPGSQRLPQGFDAMFPAATRELERRGRAGDFIGVLGNLAADGAAASFEKQAQRIGLPTLRISLSPMEALALPDALRSDHASFWLNGYPALLLTDTADFRNPRYHCGGGPDDPNTLDYDFIAEISRATAETILDIAVTADDG